MSKETLQAEIKAEASALLTTYRHLFRSLGNTIQHPTLLIVAKSFDAGLDRARAQGVGGDFRDSLRALDAARDAVIRLTLASEAVEAEKVASYRCLEMFRLLHDSALSSFPSILVLSRLSTRTHALFANGEFAQAKFTADMANREAERLLMVNTPDEFAAAALHNQLAATSEVCARLGRTVPWLEDLSDVSTWISIIKEQIDCRRLILAETLSADLTCRLVPQRDFLNEIERQIGPLTTAAGQDVDSFLGIRGITAGMSWDEATQQLMDISLEGLSARLLGFPSSTMALEKSAGN